MIKLYTVFCYGKRAHLCFTLPNALHVAEGHIRKCPEGAMPWATRVVWHKTREEFPGDENYVSAGHGSYLNHGVQRG